MLFLASLSLAAEPDQVQVLDVPVEKVGDHRETTRQGETTARYALSVPVIPSGARAPLVLVLHWGYDGPKPDAWTGEQLAHLLAPALEPLHAIVVAPDALGGDWTTAENDTWVTAILRGVMASYPVDPKRVLVTGYSMGGAGTWWFGDHHPEIFTAAIALAAPVPPLSHAWTMPAYVVHATGDSVVPFAAAERHAKALKEAGAPVEFASVPGADHYSPGALLPRFVDAVRWVQQRWDR